MDERFRFYQVLFNFVLLTANFEPTDHSTLLTAARVRAIYFHAAPLDPSCTDEGLCQDAIEEICAVPKSAAVKMVIRNFDDHSWIDRFPFAGAIRTPTAGSSRCVASKSGWFFERFKSFC